MKLILVASASAQQLCSGGSAPAWTQVTTSGLINDDGTGWATGAPAGWNGHKYHSRGRNGVSAGHYATIGSGCGDSLDACFACAAEWNDGLADWPQDLCDGGSTACPVGIVNFKGSDCRLAGTHSGNSPAQTNAAGWEGWAAGAGSGSGTQRCDDGSSPVWTLRHTGGLIRDGNDYHTVKRSGSWGHALYSDLALGCGASKEACMSCCESDAACRLINFCPTCATGSGGTTRGGGDCRLAGTYSSGKTPASAVGWEGWSYSSAHGGPMETENMETDTDKLVSSALDQALDTATIPGQ